MIIEICFTGNTLDFRCLSLLGLGLFIIIFIIYFKRQAKKIQLLQKKIIQKQILLENEVDSFGETDV